VLLLPCQPALNTKDFMSGMKASLGGAPDGPAKYFRVLGRYVLETFLRSACLEWLCQTPFSHAGHLGVSTLHTFKIDAPFKILLGILEYWPLMI
jgi:hypothetical protein